MNKNDLTKIGSVIKSATNSIVVKIEENEIFEKNKFNIQIGKYLQIQDGNHNFVICVMQDIKTNEINNYIVNTQPIGGLINDEFQQGSISLPSPTEFAYIIDNSVMTKIFSKNGNFPFEIGTLTQNKTIKLNIDGNKFFSKHIGIVGSTPDFDSF